MDQVDNLRAGDAREETLSPAGEYNDIMWEDGSTDNELLIIKDQQIQPNQYFLHQQPVCEFPDFTRRR